MIRKLSLDGKVTEFARTGGPPAGMAFDRQGNLFVCDVGKAAMPKVTLQPEEVDTQLAKLSAVVNQDAGLVVVLKDQLPDLPTHVKALMKPVAISTAQ